MITKLLSFDKDGNGVAHDYGNIFELEQRDQFDRLVIGATSDHIDLITRMTEELIPPFFILYVLVFPRLGNKEGRYQSPLIPSREILIGFLRHFREYFEMDGRHHIWIGTINNNGKLVYDHHNLIFAYGPVMKWKNELINKGFKEEKISCPSPHTHYFTFKYDQYEDEILNYWEWGYFELMDSEYD